MQFVHICYAILAFVQLESHFARFNQEQAESVGRCVHRFARESSYAV